MGRVVNILIDNLEVFEEELIRDLIKNEISYVQIGNEFHFLNHIYRFYDLEKISKLLLQESLVITDDIFLSNNDECLKKEFSILIGDTENKSIEKLDTMIPDFQSSRFTFENKQTKLNKNLIKRQNMKTSNIIKQQRNYK